MSLRDAIPRSGPTLRIGPRAVIEMDLNYRSRDADPKFIELEEGNLPVKPNTGWTAFVRATVPKGFLGFCPKLVVVVHRGIKVTGRPTQFGEQGEFEFTKKTARKVNSWHEIALVNCTVEVA